MKEAQFDSSMYLSMSYELQMRNLLNMSGMNKEGLHHPCINLKVWMRGMS
jgi:hypothetical protein